MENQKENRKRRFSLAFKLNLVTVIMILSVAAGLLLITYFTQANSIREQFYTNAEEAARNLASIVNPWEIDHMVEEVETDEFQAVLAEAKRQNDENIIFDWMKNRPGCLISEEEFRGYQKDPEITEETVELLSLYGDYRGIEEDIHLILDNSELTYVYIQYIKDGEYYTLVDPDLGALGICLQDEDIPEFQAYKDYQSIPTTIYYCSYGWLCTAYEPVRLPDTGEFCGFAGIDISLDKIVKAQHRFLGRCLFFVLLLTAACLSINMYLIRHVAIRPLRRLTKAACSFGDGNDGYTMNDVVHLDIHSNDEINDLYEEIRSMQTRIVSYTEDLTALTEEKAKIGTEMRLAADIQRSMLQNDFPVFPERDEFSLYASMTPAKDVGGDFYDFFLIDDDHLALVIADVSGKGVPAALFMMSSMILIRTAARRGGTPAEILETVNGQISNNNKAKMFVTVWLGILDIPSGVMTCANAGHEFPVLRKAGGNFELLKDKHGFVIGGMDGMKYKDYELTFRPGDMIFVYTDGVPEASNKSKEFFGTDRMTEALNAALPESSEGVLRTVRDAVDTFAAGAEQYDDLTMLCLKYQGKNTTEGQT